MRREKGRKERGAYYTPAALARSLVDWAIRSPRDRVLDPACGDGAFLKEAVARLRDLGGRGPVTGVELNPEAARAARGIPGTRIIHADFFRSDVERFDCVVGNPPYIRYQRFSSRDAVLQRLRDEGLPASGLASAWAPFTLLAANRILPGGRMALLIPREGLFSDYGRRTLEHLTAKFERVRAIPLEPLWFEGALEKVAWLQCENARAESPRPLEPWRSAELSRAERDAWARALDHPVWVPLSRIAEVRLGIVTGDKRFFAPTRDEIRRWNLKEVVPAVTSSGHLRGARLTRADLRRLDASGERVHLLRGTPPRYRIEGERRGVHLRYKCRIRDPWHKLRLGTPPDAFLSYCIHREPRLADNEAGARATNNLHAVRFRNAPRGASAAFANPVTRLSVELIGRVYGGGVMKIEPGDAGRIVVPNAPLPSGWSARVDDDLRRGRSCGRLVDWLSGLGIRRRTLETVASTAERLCRSRLKRPVSRPA